MSRVVELDSNFRMSVEQALARSMREDFVEVIVVGLTSNGNRVATFSAMDNMNAYWALSSAARDVLDG